MNCLPEFPGNDVITILSADHFFMHFLNADLWKVGPNFILVFHCNYTSILYIYIILLIVYRKIYDVYYYIIMAKYEYRQTFITFHKFNFDLSCLLLNGTSALFIISAKNSLDVVINIG